MAVEVSVRFLRVNALIDCYCYHPEDLLFVSVLALLTMLISLPMDIFLTLVMEEYAAQRPQLEDIEFNANSWLGAERPSLLVCLHFLTVTMTVSSLYFNVSAYLQSVVY
jgi:hypothetical protein